MQIFNFFVFYVKFFQFLVLFPKFYCWIVELLNCWISHFSLIGLVVIALGTGGIKPCVAAFGGDQFARPQQNKQLEQFFSIFYFAINAGSLISTFLTPILREDVECFGQSTCFPLAFGVPAVLMIVAVGIINCCCCCWCWCWCWCWLVD